MILKLNEAGEEHTASINKAIHFYKRKAQPTGDCNTLTELHITHAADINESVYWAAA